MDYKFLLVSVLLSALVISSQARKINLFDKDDMDPEFWTEISCRFIQDSEEYGAAVCPIKRQELPENLLTGKSGFWGPCSKKECNIIYYGGSLPRPKSVTVDAFVGGMGEVKIQGQRSPIGSSSELVLGGSITTPSDVPVLMPVTVSVNKYFVSLQSIMLEISDFAA